GFLLQGGSPAADPPPLPEDLKLVPRDTVVFLSIKSSDLVASGLFKRVLKEFGPGGPIGRELAANAAALPASPMIGPGGINLGLELFLTGADVERTTIFASEVRDVGGRGTVPELGAVVLASKPLDQNRVLGMLKGVQEKECGGKKYYLQG